MAGWIGTFCHSTIRIVVRMELPVTSPNSQTVPQPSKFVSSVISRSVQNPATGTE